MDARTQIGTTAAVIAALCLGGTSGGCDGAPDAPERPPRPAHCPESQHVDPPLPNVEPEHQTAEYWLARQAGYGPLDEPLLGPEAVARHNLALAARSDGEPTGQADLLADVDWESIRAQVGERLAYLRERADGGGLVDQEGREVPRERFSAPASLTTLEEWRVARELVPLRCGPYEGSLYRRPIDLDFDRNRCSTLRDGEVVQLLARWPSGMFLARTPYALGWVDGEGLSEPISRPEVQVELDRTEASSFTRRAVLTEAFSFLGEPYGWGGKDGGYDCSRFLLEVFSRFGLGLPRHSARQAMAGTFSIDVSSVADPNEKRLLLEAAARRGIVLIQFPGHIMMYLGTTDDGVPMAIHAFSEFLTPCEGTELETVNRIDRVAVSDLTLGDGTSRGDFLSRATRMTVFGGAPGPALVADAELRPAAPVSMPQGLCTDSNRIAIFHAPRHPSSNEPLRVIVTSERDPATASVVLFAPDGTPTHPETHRLDGPPFSRWVEITEPAAGRWTAVLADGDQVLACERIRVTKQAPPPKPRSAPGPAWEVAEPWNRANENLYSAFIEQLFREPDDDDTTWPDLQTLIADRDRNLLYGYRDPDEDALLALRPDCADLPYFLRAYFAWKLRLPFVYRACTRGGSTSAPTCEPVVSSNLDSVPDRTDAAAFRRFIRRIANTVHSSSPRTLPNDDQTDFYPLPLRRQSLRPGTVYADPYGHVLVVARWKPQGLTEYGVLIGADAQPDGTVGRRRFWRGSFLFTPETERVGAGFKAWRPVRYDPSANAASVADTVAATETPPQQPWRIASNDQLREARGVRAWSDAQYRGTADEFYSTMEGLINPRPLDPVRMQLSLVDALGESVERRLSSVRNGEDYMKAHENAVVDMPRGSSLFLTTGPWEDYSTPSRDMRLLISIDAVVSFPEAVAGHPERFGIAERDREAAVAQIRAALASELTRRRFEYTRSDGSPWPLTLSDVVDRADALEVAYNPNDCIEVRWGAPEGSRERATCARRAPSAQQARMEQYRQWFARRERPD